MGKIKRSSEKNNYKQEPGGSGGRVTFPDFYVAGWGDLFQIVRLFDMLLKEVVINGFKSFADRTKLEMGPGVTCIVGPNGCGKSNIVDSIRWVLGEQRAKALRGGKMQDVIFQGTDRRKPLPQCEVSLVFTDCEAQLGTNFNEVEITRRQTRDGGGDYFINGKPCRLKDIQRLFMDTGIGHSSYSFMMQGQIDQILSANPAERRAIFEEAAGITRYKAQRKEALSKLALVDQNLSRVTDVIEEVGRQIGSLKRQASKALRYKRLKHRLTHLELAYNGYQYAKRHAVIRDLEIKVENLRKIVTETQEDLSMRESSLDQRKAERAEVYQQMQDAQQAVYDLRSEKENAENQAEFASIRRQDISGRIEDVTREVEALQIQLEEVTGRTRSTEESKREAQELVGASDEIFRSRNAEFQSIMARLADAERQLSQMKQDLLIKEGNITRLRSQTTSCEVELKTFQVKHAGLADGLFQLNEERIVAESRLAELNLVLERKQREAAMAAEAVETAKAETLRLRDVFKQLQRDIQDKDREVARLSAQLATLESLQQRFEGFSDGAKAILQGKLDAVLPRQSFRPFSSLLNVDEAWTSALEVLLGSNAEAIVLDEVQFVLPLLAGLEEGRFGRACLKISGASPVLTESTNVPEWLIPANTKVQARHPEAAKLIQDFLAGCYFCEDLGAFLRFWQENPDFKFLYVATPRGELVDYRGLILGGYSRKGGKETSFIQREAQIKKLRETIAVENENLTQLNERAMQLQAEMEQAERVVEEKRALQVELGEELSSLRSEVRNAESGLNQKNEAIGRQQRQLEELESSRADMERRMEKARNEMQAAEQTIEEGRSAIASKEEEINRLRAERDNHQEVLAEVRLDLAEKRQRLDMLDRGLNEAEHQRRDLEIRISRRKQELDTMREQIVQLERDSLVNQERAAEIEKTLAVTVQSLQKHKARLNELENQIQSADEHLSSLRAQQRERESILNGNEIKLAEERSQVQFVIEKVQTEYEMDVTSIDWKQELWKADEEFETKVRLEDLDDEEEISVKPKQKRGEPTEQDLAAMEDTNWDEIAREIRHLRDRINSLGAVNLVAIEEYAELKERFDFLNSQSQDLWNSKNELLKAIDEINETSQTLFQETFSQIRKNFVFTFEKLFGGGFADLQLIEAEDVLDSGIEITARPPGTKLQTLSLLSGGQRTMTAVALLFAIYMVKPSPFCVLDELDAPLDDANIGRFTEMLRQFTRYSQFLVITHNKRTVAAADQIYGVTMQERGVTKLISMRFNRETGNTEEIAEGAAAGK